MAKTNFMNLPKINLTLINKQIITSFAVLLASLVIALGVIIPSGIFQKTAAGLYSSFPRYVRFNSLKSVSDITSVVPIIDSQPSISFNTGSKYYFVESSGLDCANCAAFHGYNSIEESNYNLFFRDYVETGKVNYVWIDKQTTGDIKKHTSVYCAGEQSAKKFFEYRDLSFKKYLSPFDIETEKKVVSKLGLNAKKFEECVNSKKYDERVQSLTSFAASTLENTDSPSFSIYQVQYQEVKKIDGKVESQKLASLLTKFNGNEDYYLKIKPELMKYFK